MTNPKGTMAPLVGHLKKRQGSGTFQKSVMIQKQPQGLVHYKIRVPSEVFFLIEIVSRNLARPNLCWYCQGASMRILSLILAGHRLIDPCSEFKTYQEIIQRWCLNIWDTPLTILTACRSLHPQGISSVWSAVEGDSSGRPDAATFGAVYIPDR